MRLHRWFREWLHLLFVGEGRFNVVGRLVGYLAAVASGVIPTPRVQVFIGTPSHPFVDITPQVGVLLAVSTFVIAAIYWAGVAWPLSAWPELRIGAEMLEDVHHKYFRLPIYNDGGGAPEPAVTVVEIFDKNGLSLDTAGEFELHWSHEAPGTHPKVSRGDEKTVGVMAVSAGLVRFEGMIYKCEVQTRANGVPRRIFFRIRARVPGAPTYSEAEFSIAPEDAHPLFHVVRLERGPVRISHGRRSIRVRRQPSPTYGLPAVDLGHPPTRPRRISRSSYLDRDRW